MAYGWLLDGWEYLGWDQNGNGKHGNSTPRLSILGPLGYEPNTLTTAPEC